MATTILDTRAGETRALETRAVLAKPLIPYISWGAILGGLVAGMATFFLLALFGLAAGITAIDPQAAEPVGSVPIFAGIWSGISMLAGAFVGAYIAARMSGMSRRTDGLLHGFVAWGVSTLFFIYLATSGVGSLLGGTFAVLGQGVQAAGGAATSPTVQQQLQQLITGSPGGQISGESLGNLQQQMQAGNREGAIGVLVGEMGFTRDRAEAVVDQGMPLMGPGQQGEGQQVAATAVEGLTRASWFLFAAVLLSLIVSLGGGFLGAKAIRARRTPLHGHAERGSEVTGRTTRPTP
jgi:hypothetical protein